jgi:hypothetical protein
LLAAVQRHSLTPPTWTTRTTSLLSPCPPCFICRSIILATFSQERRRHPNTHRH